MEVEKDVSDVLKNAISIINKNETLFFYIINNIYLFCYLRFIFYYYNMYTVSNVLIKSDEKCRLIRNTNGYLLILDNGIKLYDFFFPYESILQFGFEGKRVFVTVFVSITFNEKAITFLKNEYVSKVVLSFQIKYPETVVQTIKRNMYYHFKYNKINKTILKKLM